MHALLDDQDHDEHHHNGALDGIAEGTPLSPPQGQNWEGDARVVEPKLLPPQVRLHEPGDTSPSESPPGTHTPGQPDEQLWKTTQSRPSVCEDIAMDAKAADAKAAEAEADAVSHSRLLTKKQLSDMAWGVRELSKRLGSVNLKIKVKNVFILTKAHDESLVGNTREVAKWLLSRERDVEYVVYVEDRLKGNRNFGADTLVEDLHEERDGDVAPKPSRLRYWTEEMCRSRPQTFDFIITLGGDGTVLYASWLFQRIVPPVLSFALGSLGFLTKFDFDDFPETLTTAFRDGIKVSLRLRFEVTIMRCQRGKRRLLRHDDGTSEVVDVDEDREDDISHRDLVEELVGEEKDDERTHRPDGTYEILNDIVVDRGPNPSSPPLPLSLTREANLPP